jgi:xanthine dehydrogenase YagR molybdenum-binding subunit
MPDDFSAQIHVRHGSNIGQPQTRREGLLKVQGAATFAADNHPPGMLYAVMAGAQIARGRVLSLDVAAAKAVPGVVEVMTPDHKPPLAMKPDDKHHPFMFRMNLLQDSSVRFVNQPIAVVIAETFEAANEGMRLLAPVYEAEPVQMGLDNAAFVPPYVGAGSPPDLTVGDVAAGFKAATHVIEAVYETPPQYHNPLEPHATVALWDGDKLILDTPSQGLVMARGRIAGMFGIPPENILIRSPFLGGGFGSKGMFTTPQMVGIMAARMLPGRPVKMVLRREQMYGPVGHRAATRQTLRIGAAADGAITALAHHTRTTTSQFDDFIESASNASHTLYASPALHTAHEAVRIDSGTPVFMRAPGEAPGSLALECAMDELAETCGMDPLDFRIRNYAEREPVSGKPFSSKELRACYAQGAETFGWARRPLAPRTMRDEAGLLVGWGVGTAMFPSIMFEGHARASILADGSGLVETGAHEMGQGALTALAQIAADGLGLPMEAVELRTGTSDLPDAGIAGGSGHAATAGSAIHAAGGDAIAKLAALAMADETSPLFGAGNAGVIARNGRLVRRDDETRSESYADILARAGAATIVGNGSSAANAAAQADYAMYAHGAVFAEVKVDPELGQVRVTRLVGAFAAGRVINPRMVRSQYFGGMIWGVSFALHEAALTDARTGRFLNSNLAEYLVPVNADIPEMTAILVEEHDPHINALGIKGVGEIAITGTAGAVANAIWHATGKRIRKFPVSLDQLL